MARELNNFLEKSLNNNIPFSQIEKSLIEKGWSKMTVELAYFQVKLKLFFKNLKLN